MFKLKNQCKKRKRRWYQGNDSLVKESQKSTFQRRMQNQRQNMTAILYWSSCLGAWLNDKPEQSEVIDSIQMFNTECQSISFRYY